MKLHLLLISILLLCIIFCQLNILCASNGVWRRKGIYRYYTPEKWDAWDKGLFSAWTSIKIIDIGQSRYIANDNQYVERNKLIADLTEKYGDDAVYSYFALTTIMGYLISDSLPSKWRKGFLGCCTALEIFLVIDNAKSGIRIRF